MQLLGNGLMALYFATTVMSQASIFKGRGFGTYYYDVKQVKGACNNDFSAQNKGNVECSHIKPLSLNQVNSNFLVAMNHTQLQGNLQKYCGKKVVVTVNGVKSNLPFFIGDGCERCAGGSPNGGWNPNGAPGLDFSFTALTQLNKNACNDGHIDISWEILDQEVHHFDTN